MSNAAVHTAYDVQGSGRWMRGFESAPRPLSPAATPYDALDGLSTQVSFERGECVFDEGGPADQYYQVVKGIVRVYKLMEDGKRQIVTFALPDDFFGFGSRDVHEFSAEAITRSTVRRVSKVHAAALLNKDPALGSRFFSAVLDQLVAAQERLVVLGRKSAKARVASFLETLYARTHGQSPRPAVDLAMGRSDIADYLGLAVETVSRALAQLRETGVIDLPSPHRVVVRSPSALREIAERDALT